MPDAVDVGQVEDRLVGAGLGRVSAGDVGFDGAVGDGDVFAGWRAPFVVGELTG